MTRTRKKETQQERASTDFTPFPARPLLLILTTFMLSRIVYFVLGVKFDATPLDSFWQYVDPALLKTHLFQSLFYLHSQPPLFNLYLGLMLKVFGSAAPAAFHITFVLMGLIINAGIFLVLDGFGVSRKISLTLAIIFLVSPASILYENFLFYTYPVATMLVLSAWALQTYLRTRRSSWLLGFFVLLAMLVYTRSAFHLLWFVLIAGGLLVFDQKHRREILVMASVPFVLCLLLFIKNAAVFGSFSSSSWFGMNFARLTTWQLPVETRYDLINRGDLSTLSLVKPFRSLDIYQRHSNFPLASPTGIPVLDQQNKSTGAPNLNNKTYLSISSVYAKDAKFVLAHYPGVYVASVADACVTYFIPASSYSFLKDNREKIKPLDHIFNLILCWQFKYEDPITDTRTFFNTGLLTMAIYLIVIVYGFLLFKKQIAGKGSQRDKAVVLGYLWLTLLYITAVGNLFELGENNRFRFMIDPFALILLGISIQVWVQSRHPRRVE